VPPRLAAPPPVSLSLYPFIGPFARWEQVEHRAGIVAIVARSGMGALPYRPLFVTDADDLREAMAKLQKGGAFSTHGTEPLAYAALYTDVVAAARRQIVAELRARYQLPATLPTAALLARLPSTVRSAHRRSPARRRRV
jgi:hypothetical protein